MIMTSTLLSMLIFTGVILILVTLLNFAESKLLPQEEVSIKINGDDARSIQSRPGSTLLSALAGKSIFLPSACGGGGTCAMCKCQVIKGGGEILPTETGYINRSMARDHWRLACQVKIKKDIVIHIPEEIFNIQKWECTVVSNQNVATFIKELVLQLPVGENLNFKAGGFIQINIPEYELDFKEFNIEDEYKEDWDKHKIWSLKVKNIESQFNITFLIHSQSFFQQLFCSSCCIFLIIYSQ